ncbi:unnamed protein product, partial [Choristocarpus tenellus]
LSRETRKLHRGGRETYREVEEIMSSPYSLSCISCHCAFLESRRTCDQETSRPLATCRNHTKTSPSRQCGEGQPAEDLSEMDLVQLQQSNSICYGKRHLMELRIPQVESTLSGCSSGKGCGKLAVRHPPGTACILALAAAVSGCAACAFVAPPPTPDTRNLLALGRPADHRSGRSGMFWWSRLGYGALWVEGSCMRRKVRRWSRNRTSARYTKVR